MIVNIFNNLTSKEKKKFFLISLFIFLLIILELVSLGLLLPIIKIIFSENDVSLLNFHFFEVLNYEKKILILLSFLIFSFVIKNLFNAFLIFYKKKFLADIQVNFQSRVFKFYLNQSYDYFLENNKPKILRNLGILAEYIIVLENFINIFIEILILFLILTLIYLNNVQVGIFVTLFSIIFTFLILKIFKGKFKKYGELINIYNEKLINNYLDSLGSIRDIILQKKQNFFVNNFLKNASLQANINVKNSFLSDLPRLFIEIIFVIGISLLILVLIFSNQDPQNIIITLTFTTALCLRAIPSISKIIYQSSGLYFKVDTVNRVHDLLNEFLIPDTKINNSNISFNDLVLKDIDFSYKKNKTLNIFKNLNLKIKKNEVIGIMGPSGSGKSTLLDLICGILAPDKGNLYIDGNELNLKTLESWQKKISYISQKNYLLNDNILQNVAFAEEKDEINMDKVYEAINFAKLDNLIQSKKDGIYFNIGEDGKNLSGGQRQRIIIARAIYRDTDLLIFDEATSALDLKTEMEIFSDIKENFKNKKTVIISTHNKNNLYFCDKILNIDEL